jgi:hypothetical protein
MLTAERHECCLSSFTPDGDSDRDSDFSAAGFTGGVGGLLL